MNGINHGLFIELRLHPSVARGQGTWVHIVNVQAPCRNASSRIQAVCDDAGIDRPILKGAGAIPSEVLPRLALPPPDPELVRTADRSSRICDERKLRRVV